MSYQPNYQPGPPPGYPPAGPGGRRPVRRVAASRPGWGLGCGAFILGFLTACVIGGVAVFFLYFYNPNNNQPLARPPAQAGTPDIQATLSQTYLNNEIARQLNGQPLKVGAVNLQDVVIQVKDNSQIEVKLRASSGPASFDLTVTEQLVIQNGKVGLNVIGQPQLTNGQVPPGVNGILEQINSNFIEPQINNQVTQIQLNKRPIRLTAISTQVGFITVSANV